MVDEKQIKDISDRTQCENQGRKFSFIWRKRWNWKESKGLKVETSDQCEVVSIAINVFNSQSTTKHTGRGITWKWKKRQTKANERESGIQRALN